MQQDMKVDDGDPISTSFANRRGEKREREGNERRKGERRGLTLSASTGKGKWLACNESVLFTSSSQLTTMLRLVRY